MAPVFPAPLFFAPVDAQPKSLVLVVGGAAGGRLLLLPAAVECSPAGIQRSNELVDKLGQPLRIGFVCRQLAELSPFFFFAH
jgi:hypothetical protein